MNISAVGAMPYYYNTNTVTRNSLNKISAIDNDTNKSRVDFSGAMAEESNKTVNPLARGESKNFADILASQMAMGNSRRAMLDL